MSGSSRGDMAGVGHTLFVRHFSGESFPAWSKWGEPVDESPGLWRFKTADRDALLSTVELLMLHTPSHELCDTLTVCLPEGAEKTIPVSALAESHPLPVLHARLHHPWILDDLGEVVQTFLQPIVDLLRGGKVFAYESLCRIRVPGGKMLSGYEAFSLAKQAYRLEALDFAAIRSALSAKKRMLDGDTPIFVNVLPQDLIRMESSRHSLVNVVNSLDMAPHQVVIELVESERVNPEALVDACDALRASGFRIALDDVGTGYNGLTTLAILRPDFVKLDSNLVNGIQGSRVRMVLLEALISMSQRLGCATIAEGLENAEDVILCQDMGVHYAQGYFFARPSPFPCVPTPVPPRKSSTEIFSKGIMRLADYVDETPAIPTSATVYDAQNLFEEMPDQPYLVIVDDQHPIGYVTRACVSSARRNQMVVNCARPVTKMLKDRVQRSAIARKMCNETDHCQPWIVLNEENKYLGTLEPWVVLSQMLSDTNNAELHPLSLLPTGPVLRNTLDMHIQAGRQVLLIYIDIDYFKAFNDRYGFIRGDAMIKLLAEIVRQARHFWPDAYLGHIGGDDFIAMLPHPPDDLAEKLVQLLESFQRLSEDLYDARDLENGYFVSEDGKRFPVAALSIVVVNGATGPFSDSLKASERAAQMKKIAKSHMGSVVVLEGNPPKLIPARALSPEITWKEYAIDVLKRISRTTRHKNHHELDAMFKAHPFFELIYELDANGVQRYPNWINPQMRGRIKGGGVGIDRASKPYFRVVRETDEPYISNIYLSTASEDFCVTLSVPIEKMDGEQGGGGVLVADINLPGLVSLLGKSFGTGLEPKPMVNGRKNGRTTKENGVSHAKH